MNEITVRPFETPDDYRRMIDYYHGCADDLLARMGVDRDKMPAGDVWLERVWADHQRAEDDPRRDRFHLAWLLAGEHVGHSSINFIEWGKQAHAHLHLWRADLRRAGAGSEFFRRSISFYFERFELKMIVVEPKADNPAPNRVLEKLGFRFVRQYRGVPGPINVEQDINRYEMDRVAWEQPISGR